MGELREVADAIKTREAAERYFYALARLLKTFANFAKAMRTR